MRDILELPPSLEAPDGWNNSHWLRLDLPSNARPLSDVEWRNYVLVVSGCAREEMYMPIHGFSMRVYVFFSHPYYGQCGSLDKTERSNQLIDVIDVVLSSREDPGHSSRTRRRSQTQVAPLIQCLSRKGPRRWIRLG